MKKLIALLTVLMILAAGAACAEGSYRIECPAGAPALTVCALKDQVQTVDAGLIAGSFDRAEADFIIAPINAGAKLFKAGKSTYRLAAVVTWGNLVFASQIPDFSAETINGHDLILFGENTVNSSVALYILQEMGISPSAVNYMASAQETQKKVVEDADAIVMTAEPAATAAKLANEAVTILSVSSLYETVTGDEGFAQAGLFVRAKTLEESPDQVPLWLEEIKASADRCTEDPAAVAKDAVEMGIMAKEAIVMKSIGNCGIHYVAAKEAREQIEKTVAIAPVQYGGDIPADEFYYYGIEE